MAKTSNKQTQDGLIWKPDHYTQLWLGDMVAYTGWKCIRDFAIPFIARSFYSVCMTALRYFLCESDEKEWRKYMS